MNISIVKLQFFTVVFIVLAGFAAPANAQGKYIIGKRTTHSEYRKPKVQPKITNLETPTKRLAQKITKGKTTDAQKAESIFLWLATTIEYDNELRLNRKLQKQIYTSKENIIAHVLRRKKALCGGYAFLFEQLCEDVGVKAKSIHGFTLQGGQVKNTSGVPEHTWNAVFIDGSWRLLDITWSVSHGNRQNPQLFWYDTKPADFALTHLPVDKKWLLPKRLNSIK
ncbi:hypothetical protein G5B37_08195 [Rasiella rasia]|uniref:Transglutaminase-like domain-containing protein n=1 Tax=Rasiella rasia TaxID=2744027 RepID=A0A6G6GMA8_9FLAO|nr:transglutaminase domain-containing protein [Rasiella rasia]QIE59543.1 hypothetical protein G5B37_08195 [Rasiella rasia]